jgi:hypothetical protein
LRRWHVSQRGSGISLTLGNAGKVRLHVTGAIAVASDGRPRTSRSSNLAAPV